MTSEIIPLNEYQRKTVTNRIGLWLFILSDTFVFAGLFVARFYLLGTGVRPEVNQLLGFAITIILLVSSFFMYRAETAASLGNQKSFLRNLMVTLLLGTIFLIGVVGVEWQITPFGPSENSTWSLFFTMTGMHALHVLSGLIFLAIIYRNGRRGMYTEERHFAVEAAAVYWHFVDVIWIFFYPALYLIGAPVV